MTDYSSNSGCASKADDAKKQREKMEKELSLATGHSFDASEFKFRREQTLALSAVNGSDVFAELAALHSRLSQEFFPGGIRALESWANGDSQFHFVSKSPDSIIDKLYRLNILENEYYADGNPPRWRDLSQLVDSREAGTHTREEWITTETYNLAIDDLVRSKFVVPFMD